MMNNIATTIILLLLPFSIYGFTSPSLSLQNSRRITPLYSEVVEKEASTTTESSSTTIETDPKEAVKIFGRLAEKYIMLDASAGMCCYSACSDCEYREPGGGYRMADQSSARPKWIPCYDKREFEAQDKKHTTKWSTDIFIDKPVVTKEEFVERVINMEFVPPLGGPFLAKTAASIDDDSAIETLFDILVGEKEKLTRHRMSVEMKSLANGEEGLTWAMFSTAMGAK